MENEIFFFDSLFTGYLIGWQIKLFFRSHLFKRMVWVSRHYWFSGSFKKVNNIIG